MGQTHTGDSHLLDRLAKVVTRGKQKGVIIKIDRGVAVLRQCLWEEARDMGMA